MTTTERSEQLSTTGSALDTLRREAVALMPARLCATDAAWVEITETLRYNEDACSLTPAQLAQRATESLDAASAEWESQQEWTLTVHGEGEHPETITGDDRAATRAAAKLIAKGDYDLGAGEEVEITYHLTSGDRRIDGSVVVKG